METSQEFVADRLSISRSTKVLDIGGWAQPFNYGDSTIIDVFKPDDSRKFVKIDLCEDKFPFKDKEFDVAICSHTAEDLCYPFVMLREMIRCCKSGYFEVPHRGLESSFDVSPSHGKFPGWGHHKWIFEYELDKLTATEKGWWLFSDSAKRISHWRGPRTLAFFWQNSFDISVVDRVSNDSFEKMVEMHNQFCSKNAHLIG